jgi:hypothetical protein
MRYQNIQKLSDEEFRRATGVKRKTFTLMVEIINQKESEKKKQGGRPNKLSVEDRLLMTLEYLREYRTYFHIATSYGVPESVCYKNTKAIEDILVKSGKFSLPSRKEITMSDDPIEVILVDAAESPVERPKKRKQNTEKTAKNTIIPGKRRGTR